MSLPIPANATTACQKCGECCRRYAISTLPHELERQASFFRISVPQFVSIYTQLLVQLVPASSGEHPLALHVNMLPKKIWEKLQTSGFDKEHVMVLPMVGLQKKEYCVFFDPKTFGCSMHVVKPLQCSLFPFTSVKDNEDYAKAYDFCELSTIMSPTNETQKQQQFQRAAMRTYFDSVAAHGLEKVWPALPQNGIVIYNGKEMTPISLSELNAWLSWGREKNSVPASS